MPTMGSPISIKAITKAQLVPVAANTVPGRKIAAMVAKTAATTIAWLLLKKLNTHILASVLLPNPFSRT